MAATARMPTTPKSPPTNGFNGASPSTSYHGLDSSALSLGRSNGNNGITPQRAGMNRTVSRSSFGGSQMARRRSQGAQYSIGGYKLSIVSETATSLKRKSMAELGSAVSHSVSGTTFIQFIEWIRAERLSSLPHKGSRWDKVLIRAQHFAEQLNGFDATIRSFAVDSTAAAEIGYSHARLLLELSYENSEALDKAFAFFYKCSLNVSALLARSELLSVTTGTREELCMMYADLLTLVTDVAIRFYKTVHGMLSTSTSLDMFEVFGDTIETFRSRRAKIVEDIWSYQIENDGYDLEEAITVDVLSNWLSPRDHVLATITRDHTTYADHQAEFTCLWFQKPLSRFILGTDKVLLVNGEAGSGKTVLSASIADRLQRPISRKSVATLFCSISAAIPTQATSLHVVKSLLFQLLNLRVGNMNVYEALINAYERAQHSISVDTYEKHLWTALSETLRHPHEGAPDTVLVIDGLDEITGGPTTAQGLLDKLTEVTTQGKGVKLICLSRSLKIPTKAKGTQMTITSTDIEDDIHAVALRALKGCHHLHAQDGPAQETTLARIMQASKGSFLWAILACEILSLEKTKESFTTTLTNLEAKPPKVDKLTETLLGLLNPSENARVALSWLQAAERPLTFAEIKTLFSTDPQKAVVSDRGINVHDVIKTLRPILSIHENIIRLRHQDIHDTVKVLIKSGKVNVPIKDGEVDMLLRSLTYVKYTLQDKNDPSYTGLERGLVNRLYNRYVFLDYVVRYWAHHLQQSTLAPKQPNGEFNVTPELKKVFPTNVTLPLLEFFSWKNEMPTQPALEQHLLVSRLRKQILTESSLAVLQTYITLAKYYTLISNKTDAVRYYYLSIKISRTVLSEFHDLTVDICNRFLQITSTMTFTSRTDIVTYKEEVLKTLIRIYTKQYSFTSEIVIKTKTILYELYVSIKEEKLASEIYIEIRKATIEHYGRHSDEARNFSEEMNVKFGRPKGDRPIEPTGPLFSDSESDDESDDFEFGMIVIWLRRIDEYIVRKDYFHAELLYIELWQRISTICRTTKSIEWHEKNIEVAIKYSYFLQEMKRTVETTSVLISIWEEYQYHELKFSQTIVEKFTEVAKVMKSMGYYSVALSIYKYASSYYSISKKEESSFFSQIEEEIRETTKEVVKEEFESSTTTTSTTTTSESSLRSMFESIISSKTFDQKTMVLVKSYTSKFIEQRKWSEAITVIETVLRKTWSSFFSSSVNSVTLTSTFVEESIELVEQLAICYHEQRMFERVEYVYVRLFQALIVSKRTQDALFEKVKWLLINFYDKHGWADKAIGVFQELLVVYRKTLGPNHKLTIEVLYILGKRCREYPRTHSYWIEYYQQILVVLNKDSTICHYDAMDAIIIVARYYWEDRRYAEALTIYTVLWNTLIVKTKEYKHFSEVRFVKEIFEQYFQCLEETHTEFETLLQISTQYRETCIKTFGATSTISIEATMSLAEVSMRSEEHTSQAISLFEEVTKTSTTTTSTTTTTKMSSIKESLKELYKRKLETTSSSSKSETIEKAISIYAEQYSESRSKFTYSSMTTLTHMRELLLLYSKQEKKELIHKELSTAIVEIITKETSSTKLLEFASFIAETYQMCKMEETCRELIEELHIQIIAKHVRKTSKFSFNLTSCTQASLVFLASIEYYMRVDYHLTFTEIMAELLFEAFQYENFRRLLKANEALDKIIIAAAPLRAFLLKKGRRGMVVSLEDDIIELFTKRDTAKLKLRSKNSPRLFIIAILNYLGHKKNTSFVRSVIHASNDNVAALTRGKQFDDAYDVANCAFLFAVHHKGYKGPNAISQGFKLALLLTGRAGAGKCTNPELRKLMLQLSNKVVKTILEICKERKINFASLRLSELNQLAGVLGEQEDYETLEWLLSTLWNTREAQRSWPPQVLLNLGRRLICARYLSGRYVQAIRLCEDIAYNLRRVHGIRNVATLDTFRLLAQLYTSVAHYYQKSAAAGDKTAAMLAQQNYRKALLTHEEMLKNVTYEGTVYDDDDDELDSTAALLSRYGGGSESGSNYGGDMEQSGELTQTLDRGRFVKENMHLMKLAHQRYGGWPKSYGEYEKLNADLFQKFGGDLQGIEGVEKWNAKSFGGGKAESNEGAFDAPTQWEFAEAIAA